MAVASSCSQFCAAIALACVCALAGCGPPAPEQSAGEDAITRTNCGTEVAVDSPPERVYAAYQPAIEIAHALGISDRLVGTAFLDAEVLPEYADAQAETDYVPSLPSREGLLQTEPDFVLSGFNGFFAEDSADRSVGTRASLRDLGVQSWILSPLCPSEDGLTDRAIDPASVKVDSVYQDLRDLGALFGAEDDAERVIRDMRERIAAVEDKVDGAERPSVAIVSPGDDGGYRVAGGVDFGTRIIEHAGGTNAFADLTEERNLDIGVEELIERDPDVILTSSCCDAGMTEEDARSDVREIESDPALAGVTAVAEGDVHPFLFANRSAGVRAAHSIELVASRIHPDLVER
ncbi:iron complex transport system substrate-binding protein [Lipingzhangella halophila]|uniref:Iron complex transport system substrate-binding protein n=1 Tax=Lipingzhangella halophila TaxID=1783352 RepID=A0A7W7RFQ7_9ACTN|nr:ABC transporter substrate-binding protein [Lipingzhangella halophila]MBB4931173.1 iron complex transport system substrate-binding protein [Lipingzhangella halophila]